MRRYLNKIDKVFPLGIIGLILSWKMATIAIALMAGTLLPFNEKFFTSNFIYPEDQKITTLTSLKTWDAQHYLYLSEQGYKKDQASNWFYPLYPALIAILSTITRDSFLSGLIVSNLLSLVALSFFYSLAKLIFNKDVALFSVIALISFPSAFFLNMIYSESVFMFLSLGFFYFLYRRNYLASSLFIFFLPITRSVGLFAAVPYFIFLTSQKLKGIIYRIPTFNKPFKISFYPHLLLVFVPIVGYLLNFIVMYYFTGDPFAQYNALRSFIGGYSVFNILNPELLIKNIFGTKLLLHGFTNSLLDRLFFLFFVLMAPLVYKKTDKTLFSFYLLCGMVPIFGSFMGYMRYLLPAFPLFLALGSVFEKKKYFLYIYLIFSLSIQTLLVVMYALSYWVS